MTLTTTFPQISNNILVFPVKKANPVEIKINSDFQFPQIVFSAVPRLTYFGHQVGVTFNVLPEFGSSYVLLRGLIEFNRSRNLKFHFDATTRSFEIDLAVERLPELALLIHNVDQQLQAELRFKAELKKAIEFERRYREACAEVYQLKTAS